MANGNVVGPSKDMAIRGGENIILSKSRTFFTNIPRSEEDVRNFVRARLAHFKAPRYVRFVSEFPFTVTGKVEKFVMRKRMIEDLGPIQQATA
jgi:fatty-acyl-CoA synthase